MSKSIVFIEKLLKIATKPDVIEFFVQLLFDLKRDGETNGN